MPSGCSKAASMRYLCPLLGALIMNCPAQHNQARIAVWVLDAYLTQRRRKGFRGVQL